jgi:uncharacterized repeat protein (TIGR03803 family)
MFTFRTLCFRPISSPKFLGLLLLTLALTTAASAQSFTSLFSFDGSNGANPRGSLLQATDGNFYGTTQFGGSAGQGAVYKITSSGALTLLYSFCNMSPCTDGGQPFAGLTEDAHGNFFGVSYSTVFSITPTGGLTTLYSFCSLPSCADGSGLYAPLTLGTDGNFYGVTYGGGTFETYKCEGPCGTIFKITPSGVLTTLHSFNGNDGQGPLAALLQAADGNFYGTTSRLGPHGSGTIFKITPQGEFTLLHAFSETDGSSPESKLLQTSDGTFYGTTAAGGPSGGGVIYKMTSTGKVTVFRSFVLDGSGGFSPEGLLLATDGNFYGTTGEGGPNSANCSLYQACGTIFRLTLSGHLTTLYNFCPATGCPGGGAPDYIIQASDGNLYGPTLLGGSTACGADGSCGTVFKFSLTKD